MLSILAEEINVKHFIYSSSVAVYGSNAKKKISENSKIKPDSIYGISKYVGEMFIEQILYKSNVKTSIFRIFNTYGPGENLNFLKTFRNVYPEGSQVRLHWSSVDIQETQCHN